MKLNSSIEAYKRKEAFSILDDAMRDGNLTPEHIEGLYKYFMPPLPKVPKVDWQWVAKAVDVKGYRVYLNWLYSDGKLLYGTDGHRLHWIKTKLEKGFYCPKTCNRVNDQGKYPDTQKLIRKPRKLSAITPLSELKTVSEQRTICAYVAPDVWVNRYYLMDALCGDNKVKIKHGGEKDHIKGSSRYGGFIIMPMHLGHRPE